MVMLSSWSPLLHWSVTLTSSIFFWPRLGSSRFAPGSICSGIVQMDSPLIAPFLVARDAFRRYVQQRDACLRMAQEGLPRSALRTALLRLFTTQALADARVQADGAACALASVQRDDVFASARIRDPAACFGMSLRAPENLSAGPRRQSRGTEVFGFIGMKTAACGFLQSVRDRPGLSSRRAVDACERRFEADNAKAMACLQEHSPGSQVARACAVHFRQDLPEDVSKRVLHMAN